jgi:TRAP-type C4-dicarboxylate transport system permease small subunit
MVGNLLKVNEDGLTYMAAFILGGLVIIVVMGIISRLSGIYLPGVIDISSFLLIAIVFLPLSRVTRIGSHVNVTLISDFFSPRTKRMVTICTNIVATTGVTLIAFLCWQMFIETWESGSVSVGSPHIPLWIPQLSVVIGMSLVGIRMVIDLMKRILKKDV